MKFRTLFILMAVVLMANIAFAATEVTLTTAQQEEVLKLQAAGHLAQADSMKTVFTAQATLALQQAAARAELRKLALKAKTDREAGFANEVAKLSFEESLKWANDPKGVRVERISWLNDRWVNRFGFTEPDSTSSLDEVYLHLQQQVTERRDAAKRRAEIDARVSGAVNSLQNNLQKQIDAGARADVRLAEFIGRQGDEIAELKAQVAELKEWQPTVDSRLSILLNEANAGRVNIAACMKALEYAKYNREPKAADQAAKFVANAQATTTPVTFPANDTE